MPCFNPILRRGGSQPSPKGCKVSRKEPEEVAPPYLEEHYKKGEEKHFKSRVLRRKEGPPPSRRWLPVESHLLISKASSPSGIDIKLVDGVGSTNPIFSSGHKNSPLKSSKTSTQPHESHRRFQEQQLTQRVKQKHYPSKARTQSISLGSKSPVCFLGFSTEHS